MTKAQRTATIFILAVFCTLLLCSPALAGKGKKSGPTRNEVSENFIPTIVTKLVPMFASAALRITKDNPRPTTRLVVVPVPGIGIKPRYYWSSSNESVATVDGNGNVTGRAEGIAMITAQLIGTHLSTKIRVSVWNEAK